MWLSEAEGRENGKLVFNGDRISAGEDEKIELDCGDGHTTV